MYAIKMTGIGSWRDTFILIGEIVDNVDGRVIG